MMKISLVICVYNEEDNIQPLVEQITGSLDSVFDYEIIYVDDGSTDTTVQMIKSLNHPLGFCGFLSFKSLRAVCPACPLVRRYKSCIDLLGLHSKYMR